MEGLTLREIDYVFTCCGFAVWTLLLLTRRMSFLTFIRRLTRYSCDRELKGTLRQTLVLTSCLVVHHLLEQGSRVWLRWFNTGRTALDYVLDVSRFFLPNWISLSCTFYYIVFQLSSVYKEQKVKRVMEQVRRAEVGAISVHEVTSLIRGANTEFERLFSLLPFMWFGYGILAIPGQYF